MRFLKTRNDSPNTIKLNLHWSAENRIMECKSEQLERLIKRYYQTVEATNKCPEMILSTGRTEEPARLMQEMYEAQSLMFEAVGINYHGGKASGLRDES